jgi:hypothetical protein
MQCRNCGIEIADKALICYRCGTSTTEAKFKPYVAPRRRRTSTIVIAILVLALLVLLGWLLLHSAAETGSGALPATDNRSVPAETILAGLMHDEHFLASTIVGDSIPWQYFA